MTEPSQPTATPSGHNVTVTAALVVLVCLVGSAVALAFAGWNSGAILGLLTGITGVAVPLIAAVKSLVDLKQSTDAQTRTLDKIDHQTNGVLTARIQTAVHEALNAPIGLIPVSAPPDHG